MLLYNIANKYFEANLWANSKVSTYLVEERGINDETIDKFRLGFSPEKDKLFSFLENTYMPEKILDSLLFKGEKFNRFGNYITIPLLRGNEVTSFLGRRFVEGEPRYLNLNGGFKHPFNVDTLKSKQSVFICEGVFDSICLEQAGLSSISFLGLHGKREDYKKFFIDFEDDIYWLYDNDSNNSGLNGALDNASFFLDEWGIDTFISVLPKDSPEGKVDVNDYYLKDSENFRNNILKIAQESRLYSTTKHYKEFLIEKQEKLNKRKEKRERNELVLKIKQIPATTLIGTYLQLDKYNKALCPFHKDEKTKSFHVYDNSNKGVCFGCGWKDDSIMFVKEYFNLTFPETLEKIKSDFSIK